MSQTADLSMMLLADLENALADFEDNASTLVEAGETSTKDLGVLLSDLRDIKKRMMYAESLIETEIANNMRVGAILVLPNGKTIEIKPGGDRKTWQHQALKTVVAEKVIENAIDKETGAVEKPLSQIIAEVLEFPGIGYWKVGELKKVGVNADNYCEKSKGPNNVVLR